MTLKQSQQLHCRVFDVCVFKHPVILHKHKVAAPVFLLTHPQRPVVGLCYTSAEAQGEPDPIIVTTDLLNQSLQVVQDTFQYVNMFLKAAGINPNVCFQRLSRSLIGQRKRTDNL